MANILRKIRRAMRSPYDNACQDEIDRIRADREAFNARALAHIRKEG